MKKIFALILAIVMIASMSVVVFAKDNSAAELVKGSDENNKDMGGTVLTYGVAQAYEVTIPADQKFEKNGDVTGDKAFRAAATVSASGVKIAGNEKFVVAVASANNWELVDSNKIDGQAISQNVKYFAYVGEPTEESEALENNGAVINIGSTVEVAGNQDSKELVFYTKGTGQEGNYQDLLTFKVAISVA